MATSAPFVAAETRRADRERIVGEVGVHLDEDVEAALEPLGEAGEVGAAEAVLGRAAQHRDAGIGGAGGLDELGRPVRAVVVDDEDLPVRAAPRGCAGTAVSMPEASL